MIKKWLEWINYGIASVVVVLFAYALLTEWRRPDAIYLQEVTEKKTTLPKRSFAQTQEAYNEIGEPILSLDYQPPHMQLPDLKQKINYYGQNNRPDASSQSSLLHFNIVSGGMASVAPGDKLYLLYDKVNGGGKYRLMITALSFSHSADLIIHYKFLNSTCDLEKTGNTIDFPD